LNLFDFSRQISQLKRDRRFGDALVYFKENKTHFTDERIASNEYIISDLLYCLRGANHFDAGFKFLTIYSVPINQNTPERILSAYGWLLWSKYKSENSHAAGLQETEEYHFDDEESQISKQFHYQKSELIARIEKLIPLLYQQNTEFSRSVISNLFSIVLKSEKGKPSPSWQLVNDF